MTDFTKDAMIEAMARAEYQEVCEQDPAGEPISWGGLSEEYKRRYLLVAAAGFNAILANARIVPLEVTGEMATAFEECFSDYADWKLEINAAIEAGKLK